MLLEACRALPGKEVLKRARAEPRELNIQAISKAKPKAKPSTTLKRDSLASHVMEARKSTAIPIQIEGSRSKTHMGGTDTMQLKGRAKANTATRWDDTHNKTNSTILMGVTRSQEILKPT